MKFIILIMLVAVVRSQDPLAQLTQSIQNQVIQNMLQKQSIHPNCPCPEGFICVENRCIPASPQIPAACPPCPCLTTT